MEYALYVTPTQVSMEFVYMICDIKTNGYSAVVRKV